MSASICYRFLSTVNKTIPVSSPQAFMKLLREAFDSDEPWQFDSECIPILKGMAAFKSFGEPDPFQYIINQIEKHGPIEIWPEY